MCGGWACDCDLPKHLYEFRGKPILQRTIELLRNNGVEDIAITTSPSRVSNYEHLGVEIIPYESNNRPFVWLDAFYLMNDPVCYLFGDVVYSDNAIKTIVETEVTDIEFFASAPPFAPEYPKKWAEPFAFKVVNNRKFNTCVIKAKDYQKYGVWYRMAISWELWQVIKETRPNTIVYDNYTAINDYTCDVDSWAELEQWNNT